MRPHEGLFLQGRSRRDGALFGCPRPTRSPQTRLARGLRRNSRRLRRATRIKVRADQIRRTEIRSTVRQLEVDGWSRRRDAWAVRAPVSSPFSATASAGCGALNRQIDQATPRARTYAQQLERPGPKPSAPQRQALLIALGNNGCGPQYASAAIAGQQGGFFDRLFGGDDSGGIFSTRRNRWAEYPYGLCADL